MNYNDQNIVPSSVPEQSSKLRIRLKTLHAVIIVLFLIVGFRLVQVQIIDSQEYRAIAQKQYQSKVTLPASRGILYDRNGNVIASNSMRVSFAADPQVASDDARAIASKFSQLFGKPKSFYLTKLKSDSRFVWLERLVDVKYLKEIDTKNLNGIVVRYEPKRLYFNDQIAGQLLGCTDVDNFGLAGVEQEFDKQLRGEDGYVVFQRDGLGRARPSVDYPRVEPQNGHNIYLTIDLGLQAIAEKELKRGISENKADGGLIVMLNPKTGEVLALAQCPNVDPNNFGKFNLQDQKLRAITDVFEPGSVFKLVTASAALENGLVSPEKRFFAENGEWVVQISPGKTKKIVDTHKDSWITFQEAMEHSSNIVMAKVNELVGCERFYKVARDYGFGIPTNIEFPGEVKGVLKKPSEWSGTTLKWIAFGYDVGATPIQIASAYGAVANDGILVKPFLFKKETDALNQVIIVSHPQQIRRVVSQATAQTLKQLLEGVVERGTATPAKIPGIKIAGKTGTSKKYVEGHYETGSYIASFVGFFPTDDPKIVCLVMIDNPKGSNYYGGTTSAPVFRTIAEQIINTTDMFSSSKTVASDSSQQSKPTQPIQKNAQSVESSTGFVPDVRGYSIRRAVDILTAKKFYPVVNGSGIVINQVPVAGQQAKSGTRVILICQPKSSAALGLN